MRCGECAKIECTEESIREWLSAAEGIASNQTLQQRYRHAMVDILTVCHRIRRVVGPMSATADELAAQMIRTNADVPEIRQVGWHLYLDNYFLGSKLFFKRLEALSRHTS